MSTDLLDRLRSVEFELLEGDVDAVAVVDERLESLQHLSFEAEVGSVLAVAWILQVDAQEVVQRVRVEMELEIRHVIVKGNQHVFRVSVWETMDVR